MKLTYYTTSDQTIKSTEDVMICLILASQIASIVESGNLGQLLWRDPLKQDPNPKIQHASDPCAGICFFGSRGNLVSKASIEYCSIFPHASSGAEKEWSEGCICQLNFVDPLPIQVPIDTFMMGITGRDEKPLVG